MRLEELAVLAPRTPSAPVPDWALGCFRLHGASYADGSEDRPGQTVRLQVRGMSGGLRIPTARPALAGRTDLQAFTPGELADLASVDGQVSDLSFAGGVISRDNPVSFQPFTAWTLPFSMHRVGARLVEMAAGGAYVQDWRIEPGSAGLMVGMRLMFETTIDGATRPRDGAVLICGEHCLLSLGRHRPLPPGPPIAHQMLAAGDPFAFAERVFDAEISYARRDASGDFKVELSTDPFREGTVLPLGDNFVQTSIKEILRQHLDDDEDTVAVRQWRIDTLAAWAGTGSGTPVDEIGAAWLKARDDRRSPG